MSLIINADDFGLTRATNEAIFELASLGCVSSTTVMVNMPFAHEISRLKSDSRMGIGLHFNITQGKPIADPNLLKSLIDTEGNFYPITTFKQKVRANKISGNEIRIEFNAQLSHLKGFIGESISHIDSHQDINKLKIVKRAVVECLQESKSNYGLRWYNKMYLLPAGNDFKLITPSLLNYKLFGWKRVFTEFLFRLEKKGLSKTVKLTQAMLYTTNHNMRLLLSLIPLASHHLFDKYVLEIMVHPATSTEGLTNTRMMDSRIEEYQLLKSSELQHFLSEHPLINFNSITF